ncbi:MAG: hypothetical protein D6806_11800 [Deltaproteobacteria bacterium]|nr:MAG: hypothetical protein D6806_11800 [Deltaproteobacteria bacterium]
MRAMVMNRTMTMATLGLAWVALLGADRGCFQTVPCSELGEQACIEDPDCRPVYRQPLYDEAGNTLRCLGEDGMRCLPDEQVFDHCEQRPDCEGLDEQECLAEPECQAVYAYDESMLFDGASPRCGDGTRCMEPELVFVECLDADADPCQGLSESECSQRPACEPVYSPGGCEGDVCWDGYTYEGCRMKSDQCRTDEDCYALYGAPDPACGNWRLSCEQGVCVEHCDETGCTDDTQCADGERCEVRCGNGWCEGVCVPVEQDCRTTGCPEGYTCQEFCLDWCDETVPDPDCCSATCVPDEPGPDCLNNSDCGTSGICEPLPNVDCLVIGQDCPGTCREGAWMQFRPVLCPASPWEQDERQNPERYEACYTECLPGLPCESDSYNEICRVHTFLLSVGVFAYDIRDVRVDEVVCDSCWGCPRGDTIFVLVAPEDAQILVDLGFFPFEI